MSSSAECLHTLSLGSSFVMDVSLALLPGSGGKPKPLLHRYLSELPARHTHTHTRADLFPPYNVIHLYLGLGLSVGSRMSCVFSHLKCILWFQSFLSASFLHVPSFAASVHSASHGHENAYRPELFLPLQFRFWPVVAIMLRCSFMHCLMDR